MRSKIEQARDKVEALRLALLSPSPEEISGALPGLEEAVRCLQTVENDMRAGVPVEDGALSALKQLKQDLRIAAKLIAHGAALYQEWARLLCAAAAGYTSSGEPAPLAQLASRAGTVSLEG